MKVVKSFYDTNYYDINSFETSVVSTNEFGCQYSCGKDNLMCTCRRKKSKDVGYFSSRQIYRSQRYNNKDITDFGSVKTVYKKRVKRIYLPETVDRCVGSDIQHLHRRKHWTDNCYEIKKTSSKCVGSVMETKASVISKKLSPIIQTLSGSTSPTAINKNDCASSFGNFFDTKHTDSNSFLVPNASTQILEASTRNNTKASTKQLVANNSERFSSDSLVQHVHNLENPSYDKDSKASVDLIENKLEREYRKMFYTKENDSTTGKTVDHKSSLLKRRFMALRRFGKKEDKSESVAMNISSIASVSKRDVSITSDPPSLEARSYSNAKIFKPNQSNENASNKEKLKKEIPVICSSEIADSDCQDVVSMFKLWGKKFNFEEVKQVSPEISIGSKKQNKKVEDIFPKALRDKEKKESKKFSFFRKKSKTKSKHFKSKKGVTAGRCEVGDGLTIKVGNVNDNCADRMIPKNESVSDYNILRKAWLKRYLYNKIDSQNSVKIRWNNNMYTTSSSTVFELLDCVYKNTGMVFRSRSQVVTSDSSYYSYVHPQANFMQQAIEAWMIPVVDHLQPKIKNRIEVTISNQKWFIEKSKTFSQKMELVLHSNVKNRQTSSEFIVIDIPKGYFSDTSSDVKTDRTSDELVYNIVEYEMHESDSKEQKVTIAQKMETGDAKEVHLTISVLNNPENEANNYTKLIENKIFHRDIGIQGSDECSRYGDVFGVGIITQRGMRDIKQPILKTPPVIESKNILPPAKTCELAENFIQDYYRNCSPLCFDESKLQGSSENNSLKSFNNQRDGSKSCPNVYQEYIASAIVSSCETSSCSHCISLEEERKENTMTKFFFNKFKNIKTSEQISNADGKRVLPKDSLEVFKRRKIYAASNKSKWINEHDRPLDECAYKHSSKEKPGIETRPKTTNCKKHVSLQDCDLMEELLREQLSDKCVEGILSFKGGAGCDICKNPPSSRRARVIPDPMSVIPQPPCKSSCIKKRKPACSKKNSPTCNMPTPPPCPAGPPTACQKPCPPSPPPCRTASCDTPSCPSLVINSPLKTKFTSCSNSSSPETKPPRQKPIPPKIHSPPISKPSHPCVCPKKESETSLPRRTVTKSTNLSSTLKQCGSPQTMRSNYTNCESCQSTCNSPPTKVEKVNSQEFPWPIKSQLSRTPSKQSQLSLKQCEQPNLLKKTSSKCFDALKRLIHKASSSTIKECKPDCATRRKVSPLCPPSTVISNTPAQKNTSLPKMTGLHLKKLPMPKCPSKDYLSSTKEDVIRLNSREKITIKLRQNTPSTEEIREGFNIKVKDEDGQTLYERKDYRKIDQNRMQFVKDMYRNSQIQRLVTANSNNVLKDDNIKESSSDTSLSNILEINFNLKFKHGDKPIDVNINNCGDTTKQEKNLKEDTRNESEKEVYFLNDQGKQNEENLDKNNININITIKNYKTASKKSNKLISDKFSKNIAAKFQTVSTGYSDVIDHPTFSVHQVTVNKSNSDAPNPSTKSSVELLNEELKELAAVKFTDSENQSVSNKTSSNIKQLLIDTDSQIKLSKDNIYTSNEEKSATSVSETEKLHFETRQIHDNVVIPKIRDKEEKKRMLKEIFETSSKDKQKNKQRIRQMLRAVLTSDSSCCDIEVNNDQVKEITYESLKPNFKNSKSVTNYLSDTYSKLSIDKEFQHIVYPTKNNSECSDKEDNVSCICSKLADKLKLTGNNARGCCCSRVNKKEAGILCEMKDCNSKTIKHVDVGIQNSKNIYKNESYVSHYEVTDKSIKFRQNLSNSMVKACEIKKNKRTTTVIEDENVVILSRGEFCNTKRIEPLDVLQLYETKKAVLEIYAEKTFSGDGEKIVSRLPKFVYEKESDIRNYQEKIAGFNCI